MLKTHTGRNLGNITNLKVYVKEGGRMRRLLEAPAFGMALQERRMVAKARRRERKSTAPSVVVVDARDHAGGIRGVSCELIVEDYSGVLDSARASSRDEGPTVVIIDGRPMNHSEFTEYMMRLSAEAWGVGAPVAVKVPALVNVPVTVTVNGLPADYGPPVIEGAAVAARRLALCQEANREMIARDASAEFAAEFSTAPAEGVFSETDLAKCHEAVAAHVDAFRAAEVHKLRAGRRPLIDQWGPIPFPVEVEMVDNASPALRRLLASDSLPVRRPLVPQDSILHDGPGGLFEDKPLPANALEMWRQIPTKCVLCNGTGRVVVDDVLGPEHEITGPCACRRGGEL